jgi:phosphatidate cytidylyltransferase
MSNFWQRTLTGIVFVVVLVGAIWFSQLSFFLLLLFINTLGLWEYASIFEGQPEAPNKWVTTAIGTIIFMLLLAGSLFPLSPHLAKLIVPLLFVPFIAELYSRKAYPFQRAALGIGGMLYLILPLYCFNLIATSGAHFNYLWQLPLSYFILIWSSDTFAYLSGRAFGRHKLFERISPKKTWEGSIGGAICTVLISFVLHWFYGIYSLPVWIGLAIIIVIFGTLGDLVESMLKRSLDVKDSGNILPGHGGILDRFDSLLFSVPFAWAFLSIFG